MNRIIILIHFAILGAFPAMAQSFGDQEIQIHGFATQAIVTSNHNNYLGLDSRQGSPDWTKAAFNINDQVSDKLRVGVQLHYTRLGAFGSDDVNVDWALGDYKVNQWLGARVGKVIIRWGSSMTRKTTILTTSGPCFLNHLRY